MKKSIIPQFFLFLFLLLSPELFAQSNKKETDTIRWIGNMHLTEKFIVESNQVLIIDVGAKLQMEGPYPVVVHGKVLALGTADSPIILRPFEDDYWNWNDTATVEGGWGGFRFIDGAGKRSEFHHCIFNRGKNNIPGTLFANHDNSLVDNESGNFGGVIYAENYGTLVFENCRFQENMSRTAGGGIFARNIDTLLVHNCYFNDNLTLHQGGAVWCGEYDYLHIAQSHFISNTAVNGDIGWFSKSADNIILSQVPPDQGTAAAIRVMWPRQGANIIIENSRFHNNQSFRCVVELNAYNIIFSNNLMTNNSGASIYAHVRGSIGWMHVYNNTFAYNTSPLMYATLISSNRFTLQNNIIWQNRCPSCGEGSNLNVIECVSSYQDWQVANNVVWEGRYENGIDIITDDPLFVNPAPVAGIDAKGWEYDWRLRDDSPAINSGSSQTYYDFELPELDFEGNPRIDGRIDIGCYEKPFTGVNENRLSDAAAAYPNPFRNAFNVKLQDGEKTAWISVYNPNGAVVLRQQITSKTNEIKLENAPSGLYFLSVETPSSKRTTKIVKE